MQLLPVPALSCYAQNPTTASSIVTSNCGNQEGIAGACVDYVRDESGKTECPKQSDSSHEYYAHTKRGNDLEFYCLYKIVLVASIEEWVSWPGLCEAKGGRPIVMAVISVYGDALRSL